MLNGVLEWQKQTENNNNTDNISNNNIITANRNFLFSTNKQCDDKSFTKINNQYDRKCNRNFKDDTFNKRKMSVTRHYNKIRTTTITRTEIIQTYNKNNNNDVNDTDLKFIRADEVNNQNKFINNNEPLQSNIIENNRQINYNTSFVQVLNMNGKINKHSSESAELANPNAIAEISRISENYYRSIPNSTITNFSNGKLITNYSNNKGTENFKDDENINNIGPIKNSKKDQNAGQNLIQTKHTASNDSEPYKQKSYFKKNIPQPGCNNNTFIPNCNRTAPNLVEETKGEICESTIDMENQPSVSSIQTNSYFEYSRSVRKIDPKKLSSTGADKNLLLPLHITPGVNIGLSNTSSPRALLLVTKGNRNTSNDKQIDGM